MGAVEFGVGRVRMKDFGILFYMLTGNTLDELIDKTMFPNLKCSIYEITEKTKVKEHEILILLDKGIFKGEKIFGVQYIMGYSAYGVERRIEKMIEKAKIKSEV